MLLRQLLRNYILADHCGRRRSSSIAGLLTLTLRRNRAHVRYRLWLVASAKFLVPFGAMAGAAVDARAAARARAVVRDRLGVRAGVGHAQHV
jgi:hypothetical protein